ncbi:hypothetical protein Mapa_011233 [Marchantia paleacea]|nr:hypothetical protein Mapa_011233 [Marchantia paleacea]
MAERKEQLEVLTALDQAKTQIYHFTAIVIAGMGFFTDAYDLFCIAVVQKLLGRLYYYDPATQKPGKLPAHVASAVSGVALCGTLAGQLFFGWLGDKLGRKKVYGITLMIMIVCSIACGLSFGSTPTAVMGTLCFFRFWLGFGIGGDYPLSATIMSEYANTKTRGAFIAAVFAMQGFGILSAGAVGVIMASIFESRFPSPSFDEDQIRSTAPEADFLWRIIFILGAVPAAATYYYRMKMPETARYTALVAGNAQKAAEDMMKVLKVPETTFEHDITRKVKPITREYGLFDKLFWSRHGLQLLGTTTTWFILDVAYYSQNLFQSEIFSAVGWLPDAGSMSAIEEVFRVSKAQCLIALCSTVPGYWFTVALIDRIGRFVIQLQGFIFMTVFMLALSIPYDSLRHGGPADHRTFLALYALTFFFSNFGPNATTFIVPAELFPARLRATCHGISAASGKAGAIIGAFGFLYASQPKENPPQGYQPGIGLRNTLICLGVLNGFGAAFTFLVPETRNKSLEDLSGENAEEEQTVSISPEPTQIPMTPYRTHTKASDF